MISQTLVGVAGAGVTGAGIAQMFAEQGLTVLLWDIDSGLLEAGILSIGRRLQASADKGKIPETAVASVLGRIRGVSRLAELAPAGLVIEAIVENADTKKALFAELEPHLDEAAILATNTSSLSVAELAESLCSPDRFLGLHFFNPPTKLELVELVALPETAAHTISTTTELLTACGKTLVRVKDSPGFIVNRLLLLLINEAGRMLDEGVASAEDIDTAMRLGALHPAGPLTVADLIGLDVCDHILTGLHGKLTGSSYQSTPGIADRVAEGKLGRKTGQGFFEY